MTGEYPPEPWQLRGQLYGSLLLASAAELEVDLPPGCRLVRVGSKALIGAVWVSYEPGGVLSYHELMTTVLVRRGWRLLPTITHIWVDSVTSRDGGRALWGIPKELAEFDLDGVSFSARDETGALAAATVRPGRPLPGRWPVRFRVVQRLDGRAKVSPVRSSAAVALARSTFTADPDGPLAFLVGCRPVLSFALRNFRMSFGG